MSLLLKCSYPYISQLKIEENVCDFIFQFDIKGEWSFTISATNYSNYSGPDVEMRLKFPQINNSLQCQFCSEVEEDDAIMNNIFPHVEGKYTCLKNINITKML